MASESHGWVKFKTARAVDNSEHGYAVCVEYGPVCGGNYGDHDCDCRWEVKRPPEGKWQACPDNPWRKRDEEE